MNDMGNNPYRYWYRELAMIDKGFVPSIDNPASQHRDTEEHVDGFWRIMGAKTKPDYPVAIWERGTVLVKIGRKAEIDRESPEGQDFFSSSWFKCCAVTEEDYQRALDTGFWPDGKPSRQMSEEEKLGLPPAGDEGSNSAPIFEVLEEQINALLDKARGITKVSTQEEADTVSGFMDQIKKLADRADKERSAEKTPHDEAGKAVQAKWLPIIEPARNARKYLDRLRQGFLAAEQDRLNREAAERQRELEQQAIADAQAEAEERGEDPRAIDPAEVYVPEVQPERAAAGSQFGRSTGLRMKKVAVIVDRDKLIAHLHDDDDFIAYLQKRADSAVRAKVKLPGVESKEVPA
jgi:hypothetical protein